MSGPATNPYPFPACQFCKIRPDREADAGGEGAGNCPVMAALGRFGWPCHRTVAEVMAEDDAA